MENSLEKKMVKVEMRLESIEKKLDDVPTKAEMREANLELVREFKKECDESYASKLTEKVVYGLVGMVLLGAFAAILKLIGLF